MAVNRGVSLFWYRRICEWGILIGILFASIFLLSELGNFDTAVVTALNIPLSAAIGAVIIAAISTIARFFTPRKITPIGWIIFLCTTGLMLFITASTGGITSPYVAFWLIASIGSGVIGVGGVITFFVINSFYFTIALFLNWWPGRTNEQLIFIFAAQQIPVIVGFILWQVGIFHDKNKHDEAISKLSERLSRETSKSEMVINSIDEGVAVVDQDGTLQLLNPAGAQIVGWDIDDALDLNYRSVLKLTTDQDQQIEGDDPIQQVLKAGKSTVNNNLLLTTAAGKKILVSLVISPIDGEGRPPVGVIVVFRDITKEKKEERDKAEFISTASHEMRTPVASIEGYIALALNPKVAQIDPKAKEYLTKAYDATKHLGRLFQDLLTISKAEDGRLVNKPQIIEVVEFVKKLWEAQQQKALQKNLQYNFLPDQGVGTEDDKVVQPIFYAHIDPDRLSEVLNNLIDNAIKYTPEGQVSVDVTANNENIIIGVRDTGIGVSKEDIPHLFQKFYRVDNSYTRGVGGTGLGLYISRKIMEQSGGQLWVESELGKGSTFFIKIPRIDSEKAEFLQQQQQIQELPPSPEPTHQTGEVPESSLSNK